MLSLALSIRAVDEVLVVTYGEFFLNPKSHKHNPHSRAHLICDSRLETFLHPSRAPSVSPSRSVTQQITLLPLAF